MTENARSRVENSSCNHILLFRLEGTLFSKKYGVHLARFTHRSSNVIYASTKDDGQSIYHEEI